MSYKIRQTQDFGLILELNNRIFPEDKLDLDEKTVAWIIYDSDNKPAAFCTARRLSHGILYMDRAGVLSAHQKKGLHRKLIKARENYAKRNNYKKLITYVLKTNYASLFTLVRCDFKMYTPGYAYAGKEVLYLMKEF